MRTMLAVVLLSASLWAQYPASANALQWTGTSSTAGPFCWGFSCTPAPATVTPGESGTLMVRAEWNQPYTIGLSGGASRCLTFPFAHNGLVLNDPILFVHFGLCSQSSPILACPSGTDTLRLLVPASMPRGVTFTLQAVTGVPGGAGSPAFSFTQAIAFTVN